MHGKNTTNSNEDYNPYYTDWANIKNEVPFRGDQAKPTSETAKSDLGAEIQKTLETMDTRTSSYIRGLGSNIILLYAIGSTDPKDEKFALNFVEHLNQVLAGDKLKNAYIDDSGAMHTGTFADEYRRLNEEKGGAHGDMKYLPKGDTLRPTPKVTGDQYHDNFSTMDERTQNYFRDLAHNVYELFDKDTARASVDYLNQSITDGKLNGVYLDNRGILRTGNLADEYRGYDAQEYDPEGLLNHSSYLTEEIGAKPTAIEGTLISNHEPMGTAIEGIIIPTHEPMEIIEDDEDTASQEQNTHEMTDFEKNLHTMDTRTQTYLRRLDGNIRRIIMDNKLANQIISAINDSIEYGDLNYAYLSAEGILYPESVADTYRKQDEENHAVPYEKSLDSTRPISKGYNENPYFKNINHLDLRTRQYIENLEKNIYLLVDNDEELAHDFVDKMTASISKGLLSAAYLNDRGHLYYLRDDEDTEVERKEIEDEIKNLPAQEIFDNYADYRKKGVSSSKLLNAMTHYSDVYDNEGKHVGAQTLDTYDKELEALVKKYPGLGIDIKPTGKTIVLENLDHLLDIDQDLSPADVTDAFPLIDLLPNSPIGAIKKILEASPNLLDTRDAVIKVQKRFRKAHTSRGRDIIFIDKQGRSVTYWDKLKDEGILTPEMLKKWTVKK